MVVVVGLYSTDGFLLPQSWNSSRRVWPFISARLPLLVCHIPSSSSPPPKPLRVINAKEHRLCRRRRGCTLVAPLHPSNPCRWRPHGLNLRRGAVGTGHLDPTSLRRPTCGACERRKAPPQKTPPPPTTITTFNRCCVALKGIRVIKSSH